MAFNKNSELEEHELKIKESIHQGSYLRDAIFGFNDGLVTNFALIAGVAGAISAPSIIILVAIAETFAGAVSMALGTYISSKSQIEFYQSKIKEQEKDIDETPGLEKEELKKIYQEKGFYGRELDLILERITGDKKLWMKELVQCELQIPAEDSHSPKVAAVVMGAAYIIGSLVPVSPFILLNSKDAFTSMIVMSIAALLVVGGIKAKYTERNPIISAVELMVVGILASVVAYGVGVWISSLTGLI